jgi:hypothetical protein
MPYPVPFTILDFKVEHNDRLFTVLRPAKEFYTNIMETSPSAGKRLQNLGQYSALSAFEQRGVFISALRAFEQEGIFIDDTGP